MMSRTGTVYKKISVCSRGNRIRIPFPFCAAVVLAGLILYSPASAAEGVRGGLALCAYSVIPSLFPFLMLSPMLAEGIRCIMGRLCRGRMGERSAALLSAYVVGMLAGFPIGALTVLSQYKQGRIGGEDAAEAAVSYGKACAVVYPSVSLITQICNCRSLKVLVSPDFTDGSDSKANCKVVADIRTFWLIKAVFVHGFKAISLLIKYKKAQEKVSSKEESSKNEK